MICLHGVTLGDGGALGARAQTRPPMPRSPVGQVRGIVAFPGPGETHGLGTPSMYAHLRGKSPFTDGKKIFFDETDV